MLFAPTNLSVFGSSTFAAGAGHYNLGIGENHTFETIGLQNTVIGSDHVVGTAAGDVSYTFSAGQANSNFANYAITLGVNNYVGAQNGIVIGWGGRVMPGHTAAIVLATGQYTEESHGANTITLGSSTGIYLDGPVHMQTEAIVLGTGNTLANVSKSVLAVSGKTVSALTNAVMAEQFLSGDGVSIVHTNDSTVYISVSGDDTTAMIGSSVFAYATFDAAFAAHGATEYITFKFGRGTFALATTNYAVQTGQKFVGEGMWLTTLQSTEVRTGATNYTLFVNASAQMVEFIDLGFDANCSTDFGTDTSIRAIDLDGGGGR